MNHPLLDAIRRRLVDPEFGGMLGLLAMAIATGSVFYHVTEHWSWVDSIYFSVMTLATVGYGDVAPTGSVSKLFTVFFVLIGLGIMLGFVAIVSRNMADGSRTVVSRTANHRRRSPRE